MKTGATPSADTPTVDGDAAPHVRSNYVDCATTVDLQRKRQPTPTPSSPPMADTDGGTSESR